MISHKITPPNKHLTTRHEFYPPVAVKPEQTGRVEIVNADPAFNTQVEFERYQEAYPWKVGDILLFNNIGITHSSAASWYMVVDVETDLGRIKSFHWKTGDPRNITLRGFEWIKGIHHGAGVVFKDAASGFRAVTNEEYLREVNDQLQDCITKRRKELAERHGSSDHPAD